MAKATKLNDEERLKRVFSSIFFLVASAYILFTLKANGLTGPYNLVLIVPLFFTFLSFFESIFCYCVLKDKRSRLSRKIYILSLISAFIASLIFVFA